jgi:hypothetical protein
MTAYDDTRLEARYPPPAVNRRLLDRAMKVKRWTPYYGYLAEQADEQRAFYGALCRAASFQDLPAKYREDIETAEARWKAERAEGRERVFLWAAMIVCGMLTAACALLAFYALFAQALTPVTEQDGPPDPNEPVSLGFVLASVPAALLGTLTRWIYYALWPERHNGY